MRALHLVAEGRFGEVRDKLGSRLHGGGYQQDVSYGLRRDLRVPFAAPSAKIPITIREAMASDAALLFGGAQPDLAPQEKRELAWRREIHQAGIPKCFVAIDGRNGAPCYVQWQNAAIQSIGPFRTDFETLPYRKANSARSP